MLSAWELVRLNHCNIPYQEKQHVHFRLRLTCMSCVMASKLLCQYYYYTTHGSTLHLFATLQITRDRWVPQQPLLDSSRHADVPVAVKCHDYQLSQCRTERSCAEMMASNSWVAVKKWVTFSERIHLSVKVIFHWGTGSHRWHLQWLRYYWLNN